MPKALQIPLKPSRLWLAIVLILQAIAAVCVIYSGLSFVLTILLLALLSFHAIYQYRGWASPDINAIQYDESGFALALKSQQESIPVSLSPSSRFNPICSVLRFHTQGHSRFWSQYTLVLCPDSSDSQSLRQLRVLLNSGLY